MAERKPLVNVSGVVNEISGSDTIPVANYPTMVGDSGSGGTKGAVPAPASGDAAAGKFLKADGTFAVPSGGTTYFTWNTSASTSISATVNNAYVLTHTALQTVTLPTTAAVGDRIKLVGVGSGKWKVAQNASELIRFGNGLATTTGTGGFIKSFDQNATVELVCVVANNEWEVIEATGSIKSDLGNNFSHRRSTAALVQSFNFEGSTRYSVSTAGTGTGTFNTTGLTLTTGATAGSSARTRCHGNLLSTYNLGASEIVFSAIVDLETAGTEYECFIGLGQIDNSMALAAQTDRYAGLLITKIAGTTTYYIANADNSSYTNTSFTGGISIGTVFALTIVYTTTEIQIFIDGTLKATSTTNIPSTNLYSLFVAAIQNRSSASSSTLKIAEASAEYVTVK